MNLQPVSSKGRRLRAEMQRGLLMHRLTQAILRDRLTAEETASTRERAEAILAACNPGDTNNPVTWPRWAQLMPHLLTADLAATGNPICAGWPARRADTCLTVVMSAPHTT